MTEPETELTYEQSLELLDAALRDIEDGKLSLEETLAAVERARDYLRICQARLDRARQRIEVRPEEPQPSGDAASATAPGKEG